MTCWLITSDRHRAELQVVSELATSEGCQALVSSISSFSDPLIQSARSCLLKSEPGMQTTQGVATLAQAATALLVITPKDRVLSARFLAALDRAKTTHPHDAMFAMRKSNAAQWGQLLVKLEDQIMEVSAPETGYQRGRKSGPRRQIERPQA